MVDGVVGVDMTMMLFCSTVDISILQKQNYSVVFHFW